MTYVDTSVWCAYCYNEPESPGAVRWLAEALAGGAAGANTGAKKKPRPKARHESL